MTAFDKHVNTWSRRHEQMGDAAVGRKGEDVHKQGQRILRHLQPHLEGNFYQHGVELGCGWGRCSELLTACCSHCWFTDVFQDWVGRAAQAVNSTPVYLTEPVLPLADASMHLALDVMTLQGLDDSLLFLYSGELRRVTYPGATIISLHLAKPEPSRVPARRAELLGLKEGYEVIETDAIDSSKEPYTILVGNRA